MFCINCFSPLTKVTNSRPHKKQPTVWRRRRCPTCSQVFTTLEQPSLEGVKVHHVDGSKLDFNLGRLVISIAAAFAHDPQKGRDQAWWLAQTAATNLATEHPQPSSEDIAAITHSILKRYDHLAAIQYAAKHSLLTSARND